MERLLLLAALGAVLPGTSSGLNAYPAPCASVQSGQVTPRIPLPQLPQTAFKSTIRAIIGNKNFTVEAREYVDESNQIASLIMRQQGKEYRIIMSYGTNEVFYVEPNSPTFNLSPGPMQCLAKNMSTDDNTQLFGFAKNGSSQHLFSTSRILNFINGTEVYKGQTIKDGVPVNRWSSCVYWPQLNANFTLDYYFTVAGWQTPSGLDQVPVRAEISGMTSYPNGTVTFFNHTYQYVDFEAYVDDPETVFTTPPGVYCLFRQNTTPLPKLNRHFYYREEIISNSTQGLIVSESDIYYDYDMSLVRFDTRYLPSGSSNPFFTSTGPFTTIHDYSTGVQYTIARDLLQCSIDPIPADAQGFDSSHNLTRDTLKMRNPAQFFNLDSAGYTYVGQRMARGAQCSVFQNVIDSIPGYPSIVYEVYFFSGKTITDRGSDSSTTARAVPFRIMMWSGATLANQYEIHDFDQYSLRSDAFDITPCFTGSSSIDFEIFLKGANQNPSVLPALSPSIMLMVALSVNINTVISTIQLQNARLHWDANNVYFQGTIVGGPPSIAKYEPHVGQLMKTGQGKALPNIATAQDCATQCDNLQEWTCNNFDFCSGSQVCTLGRNQTLPTLLSQTGCTHYQGVLGGSVTQANLTSVWMKLKNAVYQGLIVFSLPLPDSSGYVDLTLDTTKMDATQKVTLTAYDITNQVINQPNRNGAGSSDISQFLVVRNKVGKSYQDTYRGVSVDDCAGYCVNERTYNCQSFHYCWGAGSCFVSTLHPDERPDMLKDSTGCDLYVRDYTSNFEKFPGISVLSVTNAIYQNVVTASQCAHLCLTYTLFHCESFDFCTFTSTCYLGQTHYYNIPVANRQQAPSCVHFSRNYLSDFIQKTQKQVPLRDNRIVVMVTPAQCAKLCVEENSFNCQSFDYCNNTSECRLSDATVTGSGQTTLESSAVCDVYIRQYKSGTAGIGAIAAAQQSGGGSSGGSTSSSRSGGGKMAGVAFGAIFVGALLTLVGLFLYTKFYNSGAGDGMAISFKKQEDESDG